MSLDLIKKQKANIQREKRKVTISNAFCHPLAYQPIPKGREDATREEISKNKKKSALDSFCSLKSRSNKTVYRKFSSKKTTDNHKKFQITPDKDAVNLFFSNIKPFVSGKKGSHVSDVFVPNKSPVRRSFLNKKEVEKASKIQSKSQPKKDQSYLGYKGTANLTIKVKSPLLREADKISDIREKNTSRTQTNQFSSNQEKAVNLTKKNEFPDKKLEKKLELRDRLGDMETYLPHYDENDIYNPTGISQLPATPVTQHNNSLAESEIRDLPNSEKWDFAPDEIQSASIPVEPKNILPQTHDSGLGTRNPGLSNNNQNRESSYGTTVKLSFTRPHFNLHLAVAEESASSDIEEAEDLENSDERTAAPIENFDEAEYASNENFNELAPAFAEFAVEEEEEDEPIENIVTNISSVDTATEKENSENFNSDLKFVPTPKEKSKPTERAVSSVIDLRKKAEVAIPISRKTRNKKNLEETRVLADYKAIENYIPAAEYENPTEKILLAKPKKPRKKINDFWSKLKSQKLFSRDPVGTLKFKFHSSNKNPIYPPAKKNIFRPKRVSFEDPKKDSPGSWISISPSEKVEPKPAIENNSDHELRIENYENKPPKFSWIKKIFKRKKERLTKIPLNLPKIHSENAKRSVAILAIGVVVALTIPIGAYVQKIIEAKGKIEAKGNEAYTKVESAKSAILSAKPEEAQRNFETAYQDFLSASESLNDVGGNILTIIKVLPGGSKIESGQNILEAGKHLTSAGQMMSEAFSLFLGEQGLKKKLVGIDHLSSLKEATAYIPPERQDKAQTLTEATVLFKDKLEKAGEEFALANESLEKVDLKDVPENKREIFVKLKGQLPEGINGIKIFSEYSDIILSVLGHNQPKQYLFLFENNDEIRATGGFIGTYGIMKIDEGSLSQLTIDGIYNPDGQLKERVIPPKPIQKMSATWSMHDANWWPDFPKSAEKVAWFYEKTGGPTVDGVIAFTPKIMEDFLKITGPIEHQKYGVTVSADNFVELSQYMVEENYDKKLNRPKQFLADLAPLVLEKIFNAPPEKWVEVLNIFSENLEERHIQMYFFDYNVQKRVSDLGWSGEVLDTPKDYLSVINTNISGLKTDKMIEQKISHQAEIKLDGSIIDNVTVSRTHRGGKEKYDWYNAVNSDWMRVYVPKGSELLHAEGYTREVDSPPLDYAKLGFIEDEMVITEESGTNTDPYSGTRVYEDSGKTVFANWTYVSPGETLTVKYSYLLPFKLQFDDLKKPADTYSLLAQKQAGDENSWINSEIRGLDNFDLLYSYPDSFRSPDWKIDQKFSKDVFVGAVVVPKGTKID